MKKKTKDKSMHTKAQKNTIFVAVITSFITTFMGSALTLSIPSMGRELNTGAQNIGWVITVYMLTCCCFAITFGRLADIFDRKRILRIGIVVFAAASAAAVLSQGLWMLLVFRAMQGIGASMIFATNIAVLSAAFEEAERGKVLGYAICSTYVGLSLGPVAGGILNYNFGWRSIFITTGVISAVAFYFAMFRLSGSGDAGDAKGEPQAKQEKASFDVMGNVMYILGIFLVMYGLSFLNTKGYASWMLAAGILVFIVFAKLEAAKPDPFINVKMLRENIPYTLSNFAALFNYGATFAVSYLLSLYLQTIKSMTSQTAGLILITSTVVMAIFSPIFGRLSDKKSPFVLSAVGMALSAAASATFVFLKEETPIWFLMMILAISGLGFSLFASPNTNAVMSFVKKQDYGFASALLATMRSAGHTFSMAVITLVLGIFTDGGTIETTPTEAIMKSLNISFLTFTIFCILGIFMALKRKVW